MDISRPGRNGGRLNAGPGPGRPPGSISLTTLLKRALEDRPQDAQAVVAKIIEDAINGDVAARKLILERVDGAVPQRINIGQLSDAQLIALAQGGHIEGDTEEGD